MTRARLVHAVLANVRPGSIVVLHANHRKFATADALPEIVEGLRAKGYELVTVSRLVDAGARGALGRPGRCRTRSRSSSSSRRRCSRT